MVSLNAMFRIRLRLDRIRFVCIGMFWMWASIEPVFFVQKYFTDWVTYEYDPAYNFDYLFNQ